MKTFQSIPDGKPGLEEDKGAETSWHNLRARPILALGMGVKERRGGSAGETA